MGTRIFTLTIIKIFIQALKITKENGYSHNLDLGIISHYLHVSHPTRSGCRATSVHSRATYLNAKSISKTLIEVHQFFHCNKTNMTLRGSLLLCQKTEGKWKTKVFKNIQGKICETERRDIRRQGKKSWFHTTCVLASPALCTHDYCHPLKKAFPTSSPPQLLELEIPNCKSPKQYGTISIPIASTKCSLHSLGGGSSIQWTMADKFQTQHPAWTKSDGALNIHTNNQPNKEWKNIWRIWEERLSPNPRRNTWQSSGKWYLRGGSIFKST